jgi:hypothetical protein
MTNLGIREKHPGSATLLRTYNLFYLFDFQPYDDVQDVWVQPGQSCVASSELWSG